MARGMWSGLAAGFAQAQERKRLEQERQDKLGLAAQTRQDMLDERKERREIFNINRMDAYAASFPGLLSTYKGAAVTKGSASGEGVSASTGAAKALAAMGMDAEKIADLAEQGPLVIQRALDVAKKNFDPESPYTPETLSMIAESIILTPEYIPTEEEATAFVQDIMGRDLSGLDDLQRKKVISDVRQVLSRPASAEDAFFPAKAPDSQDLENIENRFLTGIKSLLSTSDDIVERGTVEYAIGKLEAGDPTKVIDLLLESDSSNFIQFYEAYMKANPTVFGPNAVASPGPTDAFKQLYGALTESTQTPQVTRVTTRLNPETGDLEVVQ